MTKNRLPRKFKYYWPLLLIFIVLLYFMPRSPRFSYDYKKGSIWNYDDLVAEMNYPIIKDDFAFRDEIQEAKATVVPVFITNENDPATITESFRSRLPISVRLVNKKKFDETIAEVYHFGVYRKQDARLLSSSEKIQIVSSDNKNKVDCETANLKSLDDARLIIREAFVNNYLGLSDKLDSIYDARNLDECIFYNIEYNQELTDEMHEKAINMVSPTQHIGRKGEIVVAKGELISDTTLKRIDSYKAEFLDRVGYSGPIALQWLGNGVVLMLIMFLLFFAIYFVDDKLFNQYNKYLYLLIIFSLSALVSFLFVRTDPSITYIMPLTLIALYLQAFFKKNVVLIVYTISLLPLLVVSPDGLESFVVFLLAGVVAIYVFDYFDKGWLQFVTAVIVFMVMLLTWIAFKLLEGGEYFRDSYEILYMALSAFMSVAGYPIIYLFEKIFYLVSSNKLVELSDTSHTLLRQLADKAPGTFQHSLQVMNLSDAVARSIDADIPLIRAAALYHDIGKINNPQCFTENETPGVKFHEGLTPQESAQEITRHVTDGLALADKHKLPAVLKEFISTHHGTTSTAYFLNKYLNQGGDPSDTSVFYYDGVKPKTKEQVILMLCDSVEAASRSLKDYSKESISELVDRIVDGKADSGQLSESEVTIKEFNIIKETMKSYLQQMYHSRVQYPKRRMPAQA